MKARQIPITYDYMSPRPSYLLNMTLAGYLPKSPTQDTTYTEPRLPSTSDKFALQPTHHLIYFSPMMRDGQTAPDGTDPRQAPGQPFSRRMWAGGEVHFNNSPAKRLNLDNSRAACIESIVDVNVKKAETENPLVFVSIERRMGSVREGESDAAVRERFSDDSEVAVKELRNVVFMKPTKLGAPVPKPRKQVPEHQGKEDFSHTLVSNPKLLFRYSALTYNTRAIHLDPEFCKKSEGLKGLVFHGPLTLTLLATLLKNHLIQDSSTSGYTAIKSMKYRNTSPLFDGEPVKLSGRQTGDNTWSLWAETPEGNLAAVGEAVTEQAEGVPRDCLKM